MLASPIEVHGPARPFAKMAGGKSRLLPRLLEHVPERFGVYHEPFVGGGALFWALASSGRVERAWLSDTNADLVAAYRAIKNDAETLASLLDGMPNERAFFEDVRAEDAEHLPILSRAQRFIYLNKTAFNGLWRTNRQGRFNVPFAGYERPAICDRENLLACSAVLRRVQAIVSEDPFERVAATAREGDLVYLDPPYPPLSKTSSFTAYGRDAFRWEDHVRLRDVAASLKRRGVHVLISNSDQERVRELYADGTFRIHAITAPRSVSARGDRRTSAAELVIT